MDTPNTPTPRKPASQRARKALAGLTALMTIGAGLWGWSGSEGSLATGLQLAANLLPAGMQLQTQEVQGSLRQGGRIGRLVWHHQGLTITAQQTHLDLAPLDLLRSQLPLHAIKVDQMLVQDTRPDGPATPFSSWHFPLQAHVAWQVKSLLWNATTALEASDLQGSYRFDGLHHRLQLDSLQWAQGRYSGVLKLQAAQPMLLDAIVQGDLHIPVTGARTAPHAQAEVRLQGPLSGSAAQQTLQASVRTPAGVGPELDLQGVVQLQDTPAVVSLQAQLKHIDLATLWPSAPHTHIGGQVQLIPAGSGWQWRIDLNNTLTGPWNQQRLPLQQLQTTLLRHDAGWQVQHLLARWPGGQLQGQGQWQEHAWTGDWRVQGLQPGQWFSGLQGPALSGHIAARQEGPGQPLALQAQLRPTDNRRHDTQGLHLEARLDERVWSVSRLALQWQDLQLHAQGQWDTQAQRLQTRASWQMPGLQGSVDGDLSPRQSKGQWQIDVSDLGKLRSQWQRWFAQTWPVPAWLHLETLQASGQWQGGWADAGVQWQARLQTPQWQLQTHAQVQHQPKHPDWQWRLTLVDLQGPSATRPAGPLQLQLAEPVEGVWQPGPQRLQWSRHRWRLRDTHQATPLDVEPGHWQTALRVGGQPSVHVQASLSDLPLRWSRLLGLPEIQEDLLMRGGLELDWGVNPHLLAWLERSQGDVWLGKDLQNQTPLMAGARSARAQLRLDGPQATIDLNWDSTQAGQLHGQLRSRLNLEPGSTHGWWPGGAPISGRITAGLPRVEVWSWLAPPGWRVQGSLDAEVELAGTRAQPQWQGRLQADDLAVRSAVEGVAFRQGRLRARLQDQQMVLESFELQGAGAQGGSVFAQGHLRWNTPDSASLSGVEMDLQMQSRGLRVTSRADRRLSVSGDVNAKLVHGQMQLRGTLQADSALFVLPDDSTPTLGKDVVIVQTTPSHSTPAPQAPSLVGVPDVQVLLRLGPDFQVRGQGIDTRLAGEVQLVSNQASGARPRLSGAVHTEGGRYRAYGRLLDIEQGLLRFAGPFDNPDLDILALRPNLEQRVGVRVTGNALTPRIRLYADPDMPDADKLAWLVLGRSAAAGGAESAVLQQAAVALLGGNGKGLGGELAGALGFDDISLANRSTSTATGTPATGTAVMLGKRLSKDFYLAYESSVNGAFGNLFIFYDLSRKLMLRAQAGELNALDLLYTIRHD